MSDLSEVLPDFDIKRWRHLTHSLEKNDVTVAELISLDPIEIAKRCPLPLGDLKIMTQDVVRALHLDIGLSVKPKSLKSDLLAKSQDDTQEQKRGKVLGQDVLAVKTLDTKIDECLGGGFRTGHVTEIVGESAVGKTQFVLGLLLSAQLSPPVGLGKSAIYLSTEAPLNTTRLRQMLISHPFYKGLDEEDRPSLDRIHTISANSLEIQEHITRYQLSVAVQRFNVGLVVMDSVAANFRAEHETKNARGLFDRATDLNRLGNNLRMIARDYDVAVVVVNQVSDRFDDLRTMRDRIRSSSPLFPPSPMRPPPLPSSAKLPDESMTLDHQQRFFTGWGDQPTKWFEQLKTPALGLSWANQLSARVVLKLESDVLKDRTRNCAAGNIWKDKKKRRYVGVVFAPWTPQTLNMVEYEVVSQGVISILKDGAGLSEDDVAQDMLDPSLWFDGGGDDEEFP